MSSIGAQVRKCRSGSLIKNKNKNQFLLYKIYAQKEKIQAPGPPWYMSGVRNIFFFSELCTSILSIISVLGIK